MTRRDAPRRTAPRLRGAAATALLTAAAWAGAPAIDAAAAAPVDDTPGCEQPTVTAATTEITIDTPTGPRSYQLVQSGDPTQPRPLIVSPHFLFGTADGAADVSGFTAAAARQPLVIAYPHTRPGVGAWNMDPTGDDVTYIAAVTRDAQTRTCVNPRKVGIAGFSQGAVMASILGCVHGQLYPTGYVAVAGAVDPTQHAAECRDQAKAWVVHGTADTVARLDGTVNDDVASILGPAVTTSGLTRVDTARTAADRRCGHPTIQTRTVTPWGEHVVHSCDGRTIAAGLTVTGLGHDWPTWAQAWALDRLTR